MIYVYMYVYVCICMYIKLVSVYITELRDVTVVRPRGCTYSAGLYSVHILYHGCIVYTYIYKVV